jgi:hypothetical protein
MFPYESERTSARIQIVLVLIPKMFIQNSLTPFVSLLEVYKNFKYQLESFHFKICIRNNN